MTEQSRLALVTGAGRGIGLEYARLLCDLGHRVVLADLDEAAAMSSAKALQSDGAKAFGAAVDVSDQASTLALAAQVSKEHGAVEILVNNAAIYHSMRMDTQMTVDIEYWRRVFAVNLEGALLMTQALAPGMVERGWGRIVNQASTAAYKGLGGDYSCSKLALIGLTQGFARELGPHGITVNAIAPGPIFTEATRATLSADRLTAMVATAAIPREAGPTDVCGALKFFVSEDASWITGQTLIVDGGIVARV